MELTRLVDDLTATLEATLMGAEKDALIDTERPFVVQRNSCSNSGDAVSDCITQVTNLRRLGLEAAMERPVSIFDEILSYEYLTVSTVLRYGDRLEGRPVRVNGCFVLDPGPTPELRLTGTIRETCSGPDAASVPVQYDRMDAIRVNFYLKEPSDYWFGRIALRDGRPVLLMSGEND